VSKRTPMTIVRGPTTGGVETAVVPYRLLRDMLDMAFEQIDQRTPEGKIAAEVIYAVTEKLGDMFWQRPATILVRSLDGPCELYGGSEPGDDCEGCGWEATWHKPPVDGVAEPEDPVTQDERDDHAAYVAARREPVNGSGTFDPTKVTCWHGQTPPCSDCRERRWGPCAACGHIGVLLEPGVCEARTACLQRGKAMIPGTKNTNAGSPDDLPF
jgi:hypothetical protein